MKFLPCIHNLNKKMYVSGTTTLWEIVKTLALMVFCCNEGILPILRGMNGRMDIQMDCIVAYSPGRRGGNSRRVGAHLGKSF